MKTITIRDSTYTDLKRIKKPNMSFSDVIDLLLESRSSASDKFFGVLSESSVLDEIAEYTTESRRNARSGI